MIDVGLDIPQTEKPSMCQIRVTRHPYFAFTLLVVSASAVGICLASFSDSTLLRRAVFA